MIPTDTTTAQRFTPPWRQDEGEAAPVYFYRGASVRERGELEAELAGEHDARRIYPFEMVEAFKSGVTALLDEGEGRDRLLKLIDQEDEELDAADRQLLLDAQSVLRKHWPEYRELLATKARRLELAPIVAFQRLCVGWEGLAVPFERGRDGRVSEAALKGVDWLEMIAAGNTIYASLYDLGERKDFLPQSPSDDSPKGSRSGGTSKAAGRSAKTGGTKTRASRSGPTSGSSSTSGS